jgi:hypothetical protein
MNFLCIESLCPQKTHNRTLLFGRTRLKHGRHFDYWIQPPNMRMRVCYLHCHETGMCCYLVIHIENLLHPLQLFYFHLWPVYWPSQFLHLYSTGLFPMNLNSGRLHKKHSVGTWKLRPISASAWRLRKAKTTCVEMANRRTYRIRTDISSESGKQNTEVVWGFPNNVLLLACRGKTMLSASHGFGQGPVLKKINSWINGDINHITYNLYKRVSPYKNTLAFITKIIQLILLILKIIWSPEVDSVVKFSDISTFRQLAVVWRVLRRVSLI